MGDVNVAERILIIGNRVHDLIYELTILRCLPPVNPCEQGSIRQLLTERTGQEMTFAFFHLRHVNLVNGLRHTGSHFLLGLEAEMNQRNILPPQRVMCEYRHIVSSQMSIMDILSATVSTPSHKLHISTPPFSRCGVTCT